MNRVCVSVCTRERPEMLRACLTSAVALIEEARQGDRLLVVENDAEPRSQALVEELARAHPQAGLAYLHEPQLGIPFARNRCLDFALQSDVEWLAFIDDDETLDAGWLEAMRRAAGEMPADVLTGPVATRLPEQLPVWMERPKEKKRSRGQTLATAATNNTWLRLDWWRADGSNLRFDERLRFTGGSDTDFFYRVANRGGRIFWVDDAVVCEEITAERLTLGWNLQRTKRSAANHFRVYRKRDGTMVAVARIVPKALGRLVAGVALLASAAILVPVSRRQSQILLYKGAKSIVSTIGSVQGMLGVQPDPYRKVLGR